MSVPQNRTVVDPAIAAHDSPPGAESTIEALGRAGPDMEKLSIVGGRYRAEEHAVGSYSTGDWITDWGGTSGFWDAFWSLFAGPAVSVVPQAGTIDRATAQVAQRRQAPDAPGVRPRRNG